MNQECLVPRVFCASVSGSRKYDTKVCGTQEPETVVLGTHEPGTSNIARNFQLF